MSYIYIYIYIYIFIKQYIKLKNIVGKYTHESMLYKI